ncbi:MAG: DNA polymerase II large subunit [archaeon]
MAEASPRIEKYMQNITDKVLKVYDIVNKAKSRGFDPDKEIQVPLAKNMAERVEGLISTVAPEIKGKGVVERLAELEKEFGSQDWRVALKIAEEVATEKFCKFVDKKKALETGIRVGFSYVTVGVVSSPLEGFIGLTFNKRKDNGKEYFCLMYGGPVRSAGGTAASVSVLIADYVRKKLGYATYDATEEEVKRAYTELCDYNDRVTNLQYFPSQEEVEFLMRHIPVQVSGDPSEKFEVSNYKDLDRIETNRIRNGFCLVIAECLCLKAPKLWKKLDKWGADFYLDQWNFMKDFVHLQKEIKAKGEGAGQTLNDEEKVKPDFTFIKDLVAGRPVIGYPLRSGTFRLRYGRGRISGFSSNAIHPASMVVLNDFIAVGSQLRTERPGKSTTIAVCDTIDGPIVKLKDGSVKYLETEEEARKVNHLVEEVIYLGDILINYGDFLDRAHKLIPCGFVEEWWVHYLRNTLETKTIDIDIKVLESLTKEPIKTKIDFLTAAKFCSLGIPLHPKFIYYWNSLTKEEFVKLYNVLKNSVIQEEKIIVANFDVKRSLELIGLPHNVVANEYVVIEHDNAKALLANLGGLKKDLVEDDKVLVMVNSVSDFEIRDKCGYFIGTRMGRPEKAKMRKMIGSPHMLFPIGEEGGRLRSMQSALEKGKVTSYFPTYLCDGCGNKTIWAVCEKCQKPTKRMYYCRHCGTESLDNFCDETLPTGEKHGECMYARNREIDVNYHFDNALKTLGTRNYSDLIKGVRSLSSKKKIPENIVKGILRAQYNLYVNKEGTIRYDMTEMVCTHFKPVEIGTSIEVLRKLGYEKDIRGAELENENQILEILPQDVILPACSTALEEGADLVLFRTAQFLDDLLKKLYGLSRYYNLKSKEDLVGHLIVAMSPHTSAGIISRIIGFSKTQGFLAHPLLHSIMRRDCVHPTTDLVIKKENEISVVKIGDYVDSLIKRRAKTKRIDVTGTLSVENIDNVTVFGVDAKTFKFKEKKVTTFIKGPINKKWIKIKSETNKEFICTLDHNYLSFSNERFNIKKASEISQKDKFVVLSDYIIKNDEISFLPKKKIYFDRKGDILIQNIKNVSSFRDEVNSYCLDVDENSLEDKNVLWGDNILNLRCDGDEAGCMLLMDCLLNFSRAYLPNTRGITQDAPLVLTSNLIPAEVDDMVFNMDIAWEYPLEFYEAAEQYKLPWDVKVDILDNHIGKEKQYEGYGFTHDVENFNKAVTCSQYKLLPTMKEKVLGQMAIAKRLRAVNEDDVARLIIERHFMRDIKGNLRKFSMQKFRCVKCNESFRRPPLIGKCTNCGGKIIFTIHEGSVVKYVAPAMDLAEKYNLPPYLKQTLVLTQHRIESVFGKDPERQEGLGKWFN